MQRTLIKMAGSLRCESNGRCSIFVRSRRLPSLLVITFYFRFTYSLRVPC